MKRILIYLLLIAVLVVTAAGIYAYRNIYEPHPLWEAGSSDTKDIFIRSEAGYAELEAILFDSLPKLNEFWFQILADRMNLTAHVNPGRYVVDRNTPLHDLIIKFRSGDQDPVKVLIPVKWTMEELSAIVSRQVEADSASLHRAMMGSSADHTGNLRIPFHYFIPNTYEFYWNTSADAFVTRMKDECEKFWQRNGRMEKAESLNLSPQEVYTLASIVYRETSIEDEMPKIAGVYLNRLERGIALQADPTVKFASGDLSLRRILNKHLAIDSPYNTYKYPGLPPGPISMADIQSIDAVLNASKHNYIYFCARPDSSGRHNFSENYSTHLHNARKFHNWLNERKIR